MGWRRVLVAVAGAVIVVGGGLAVVRTRAGGGDTDPYRSLITGGCGPAVVPAGQATPSGEPEPLRPVWCYRLPVQAASRVDGGDSWVDDFDTGMNMGRFQ